MRRLILAIAALSVFWASGHLVPPKIHACSVGDDFDPVAQSEVIVAGRFLSYKATPVAEPIVLTDPKTGKEGEWDFGERVLEEMELAIDRALKGTVPTPTIAIARGAWVGQVPTGFCGSSAFDPTGRYAVLGMTPREDGTYTYGFFQVFFMGDGPYGERYARALSWMASFPGAAGLPALGAGPSGSDVIPRLVVVVAGIAASGVALILAATAFRLTLRRRNEHPR